MTPQYYWSTIIKIIIVLAILFLCYLYFPSLTMQIGTIPLVLIFIAVLLWVTIYIFNKKYVNFLTINYSDKTIEVNYIKPFKVCNYKTDFNKFGYEYFDNSYGFFPRRFIHKVLRMNFDNILELKISQLETTFPIETMNEIVKEFERLGMRTLDKSNLL